MKTYEKTYTLNQSPSEQYLITYSLIQEPVIYEKIGEVTLYGLECTLTKNKSEKTTTKFSRLSIDSKRVKMIIKYLSTFGVFPNDIQYVLQDNYINLCVGNL